MQRVEESLPLGVRIWMMRKKGELLQKNSYSCVIMLLRLKTSAWKRPRATANTTKKLIVALHPSIA